MSIKTKILIPSLLLLTITIYISCCSQKMECIVYRLQRDCSHVFYYDGKLRTFFMHNPECASVKEFKNKFSFDFDTSFFIKKTEVSIQTDSLVFVFEDIEATTCMKFSLCIHGKNAESYVHFPEKKAGKYSFSITEKERNILEALIETAQTITDGVYCADSYCTSSFQFRLFGDYGTLDYICISDIQDLCNNLYVARDFILMLNNKYCIEENIFPG